MQFSEMSWTSRDWALVDSVWQDRSSLWREAFSYIVVEGPIEESRNMLLRAVRDREENFLPLHGGKMALTTT